MATVAGTVGGHTSPRQPTKGLTLSFVPGEEYVILRAGSHRKLTPSEAQLAQRQKYQDCDCLWKARDPEQVAAWRNYIDATGRRQKTKLDYYRLFMSDCLQFNLVDYLEPYLFAEWQLISIEKSPEYWRVTVKCGSSIEDMEPVTETDFSTFKGRLL